MLLSILRKLSSLVFCLLFANSVWADNVLVIHMNYVGPNVKTALENAGHTVTMSTSEITNTATLAQYDQIWDTRYNTLSSTQASAYDTFVKNGGFLYLTTENPGCCQARNNVVAGLISSMGGGSGLTIGGSAGYASNTGTYVNETYMTPLNGSTITFAAVSAIANYGNGQWLIKDASGKVQAVMWAGGAGNLSADYTGTVITVADINWIDNTRYTGNNIVALDDIIDGIVYGTVQGTIDASGTSGGGGAAATPSYSSGITAAQALRRNAFTGTGAEVNADIEGSNNDVYIHQAGTHYLELGIVGGSNTVNIEQTSTQLGIIHYAETDIVGNSNTLDLVQSGDGDKTAFVSIAGDNNIADVLQKDTGSHYLQLDLIGDGHDATVVQEGAGNHAATVELTNSGGPWSFNLNQQGNTDKEYSLPHDMSDGSTTSGTCYVAAGCSLTVIQQD
jgi:hypothetical protein